MSKDVAARVIEQIDSGSLRPRSHAVCRHLAENLPPSGLKAEIIEAFDDGSSPDERLSANLWAQIDNLPVDKQGALRILVALTRPDEAVDFHLAEYLISWSEDEGLSDTAILSAFGVS